MGSAFSAPVINDVSTCLEGAPSYKNSQHAPELPENFKKAIIKHYPHLKPVVVPGGHLEDVFAAAKKATEQLRGARIVYEDEHGGVLELVDVTPLLKFKDDVVIRVQQKGGDVVVDVRSASRLGKGDLGANAARIAKYLAALRALLGQSNDS
ncbi:hypothetical protein CHLNCDRAFT_143218 [Chlorella variabilis]|uniref:DUF1499 domain-containing protein n=1 Tax=Chlorella variabilis TaxID=554065 RepID=E1Z9R1_CHLVA|nr:hypothetical protein CHLNCDRAFT_143218 [Chlorella variabilis]EFN57816.1 hypothetical protein CHLNCDRAFT_143218 [Chlorella variabilis]|eukprot:XP_005849918.1 hypothetical protein CHLNCDRAFT_143218 [Chlorella variabilis]